MKPARRNDRIRIRTNCRRSRRARRFGRYGAGLPVFEPLEPRQLLAVAHPGYVLFHPAGGATPFSKAAPYGLSPTQIRHAYGFDQITLPGTTTVADGSGQTIAIVDAYNDPNIRGDLQAFDQQFGLPDMDTLSFVIMSQTGSTTNLPGLDPTPPGSGSTWDLEISLDVEVVHALAPAARIILVEANSSSAGDLQAAVNQARQKAGVVAVSMSFGYPEFSEDTTTDGIFTTPAGHVGITFVAATGDSGQPGFYPSFSPNVLAAGGTTLSVDADGNRVPQPGDGGTGETGWSGSGGGISILEPQPAYQNGVVTQSSRQRTTPDVAFDGDPNTGFSIYDSYDYGTVDPWIKVGGTSLAAPAWAALIALADQARASIGLSSLDGATQTLPMLYSMAASDFNDIITGNNGTAAGPGYDLVTGRGTPKAAAVVNDLVGPFQVALSNPAAGSSVGTPPSDFAITFASPYDSGGIVASDLTVNGIAADSFSLTDATTITFHFNASPVTAQGLQSMAIAAGALSRAADGSPLSAFSASFRYDTVPIAIDSMAPASGSIVQLPLAALTVHFNEAYDPTTINVSNLTLGQGTVTGFSLVDSQTVQYSVSGLVTAGTLSLSMPAGAVTDIYGNPGLAYAGTLLLNAPTTAFPTPLVQLNPAGSLIYENSADGSILFAGNTVAYTLPVAGGQAISVVVTPSPGLQPQVILAGRGANAAASSPGRGASTSLQTIAITADGIYTLTVSGLGGTTGNYAISVYLNDVVSPTASGAGPNRALQTAQNIDGSFLSLDGSAERAAVTSPAGVLAGPNAFGYSAITISPQFDDIVSTGTSIGFFTPTAKLPTQLGPSIPSGISFPFFGPTYNTVFVNPHGLITLSRESVGGSNTDLSAAPTAATIAALWDNITVSGSPLSACYYKLEPTAGGSRLVIEWYHVSFVGGPQTGQATFEAILNPNGTILFNYLNFDSSMLRPGDPGPTVGIKNSNVAGADRLVVPMTTGSGYYASSGTSLEIGQNLAPTVSDYYSFTLTAGQSTTVAVASQNSAAVHVSLLDSQGNVVTAGSSPGAGASVNESIAGFVPSTTGTYYALVTGAAGAAYNVVVTRDCVLGLGNNTTFASAQTMTGTSGALGAITPSASENWYSVDLPAHSGIALQTFTPGSSNYQFVNTLKPVIQLYDASDHLIASGQGAGNQTLGAAISAAGVYRIRVSATGGTTGEYFLSSAVSTIPPEVTAIYASGGAAWNPSFYAYLAASGLGDAQLGYRLLGGDGQLLPLPWNNIATISVVFNQDVAINTAAAGLDLIGSADLAAAPSLASATFSYSSATHTAQWTFSAPLTTDKYLLELPSTAAISKFGMSLDGEWSTQSSNFPSGDGVSGGDLLFRFNVLPGAVTQSSVVTGVDGGAVRTRLFADTNSTSYSPLADVNGDGAITSLDGAIVRANLLQQLPSSDPVPPGGSGGGGQAVASSAGVAAAESGEQSGSAALTGTGNHGPARGGAAPRRSIPNLPLGPSLPGANRPGPHAAIASGKAAEQIPKPSLSGEQNIGHSRLASPSRKLIQRRLEAIDAILEDFDAFGTATAEG